MPKPTHLTCLCGDVSERASILEGPEEELPMENLLCHCDTCRHSTGALCTSYFRLKGPPSAKSLGCATGYHTPGYVRYFCKNCGCHTFAFTKADGQWLACSGTLETDRKIDDVLDISRITHHEHVGDAADGGIAPFLSKIGGRKIPYHEGEPAADTTTMDEDRLQLLRGRPSSSRERGDHVDASCHCGSVRFRIEPPPYDNESQGWYVPSDRSKYYARLCCCRSCRLGLGFTMQPWAYIPPSQIRTAEDAGQQPILFGPQHEQNTRQFGEGMRYYQSSEMVLRGFCTKCGATMLYQPFERPYIINVSVGILRSKKGNTMAREWLDWDRKVVSKRPEAVDEDVIRSWLAE
ncbi:hypothetical protein H2204_002906 [Knufia peltigerae]|uniref:CENP-V/GFA domain-containing protein n=1 Tax=Knufia peltigerae TaxID=1002370 RepID=A0AA38YA89_9EURO|nr:hypothetical protein H2204_002906 [Knufia peltigerae]